MHIARVPFGPKSVENFSIFGPIVLYKYANKLATGKRALAWMLIVQTIVAGSAWQREQMVRYEIGIGVRDRLKKASIRWFYLACQSLSISLVPILTRLL